MLDARPPRGVTWVIGHRGAPLQAPENTLASFRRAVELGADMVELDVRHSADGALVVHHDAYLEDGRLIASTAAVDLALPSLADALAACTEVLVDVEVKNDPDEPDFEADRGRAADVVGVLRARGEGQRVLVSSFDLASIDRVRALGDDIATAWLVEEVPQGVVELLLSGRHQALHPEWEAVTPELIDACHAAGLAVSCWTCDDAEAMVRLAGWGIDGICTNVPDVAVEVLGPRR
jgi:glycerophosphoryl diester phosphodiesterase